MTLTEFRLLSAEERADIIYKDGVFIGKRNISMTRVVLYQVESFFVEIYYAAYRKEISYFNYTHSTDILSYYPLNKEIEEAIKYITFN